MLRLREGPDSAGSRGSQEGEGQGGDCQGEDERNPAGSWGFKEGGVEIVRGRWKKSSVGCCEDGGRRSRGTEVEGCRDGGEGDGGAVEGGGPYL